MNTIGIRYYFVQLKRAIKNLPYMLLYLFIMSVLAFTLFKACVNLLATENMVGKINIGVILPQDDETAKFAVSLVTSMDSVSSMCEFQYMDELSGREALQKQEIFALVLIPEHLLEDIMMGINTPVTIMSMDQKGVEAELFHEFTQMGIDMLGYSQMGVYAVDAYCAQDEVLLPLAREMNLAINEFYIRYIFSRLSLFKEKEISATGDYSFVLYYVCAGIVILTMMSGIPMAFYFGKHNDAFLQLCKTKGLSACKRTILSFGAMTTVWSLLVSILFWCFKVISFRYELSVELSAGVWIAVIVMGASIIAYVQLVYTFTQEKVWGILILFFSGIGMMFLSGGFIPMSFLPNVFKTISVCLPTTYWIQITGNGLLGDRNSLSFVIVVGMMMTCLLISCAIGWFQESYDIRNRDFLN